MKYILKMNIFWKDILRDNEHILFLSEDIKNNTFEIEVEDIHDFTSQYNFHIEYELHMPGLIKLGLNTVGIIISPNYRNEELDNLMTEMFKKLRKHGYRMNLNVKLENYKSIYPTMDVTTFNIEDAVDPKVRDIPTVRNLINEIDKIDTPKSIQIAKRLEDSIIKNL